MRQVKKNSPLETSIKFNDAHSMSTTSYFPIAAISFLLAALCYELVGIIAAVVALLVSLIVLLHLRRKILISAHIISEGIEFQTLGGVRFFVVDRIRAGTVYGIRPAFSLFLVVWLSDRLLPFVLFAGALSTSAGGYKDTIEQLRKMLKIAASH